MSTTLEAAMGPGPVHEAPGFDEVGPPTLRWWLGVMAVTLLALGLRTFAINSQSFWYDEAVTAENAEASYKDIFLGRAKDQGNPPFHTLLVRLWSAQFGHSEVGMRSLSVVCGVLAVPLLALLGRRLVGPAPGLLASTLLAISPLEIELSNEARTYALLHLLVIQSHLSLTRWVQEHRLSDLALYSLTLYLSCYSHYYALALPMIHGVALVVSGRGWATFRLWLGAIVVAVLLWSSWLPSFVDQLTLPGNLQRLPGESWKAQFLATPVAFGLGRTFAWRGSSTWMFVLALVGVFITLGIPAIRGFAALRHRPLFNGVLLAGWFLVPILGPLILALLGTTIYSHRYGSIGLPAFLLIVGLGLEQLRPPLRSVMIGLLLALTAVSLFRYATRPVKDDWRPAAHVILTEARDGEPILFDTDFEVTSFRFYAVRSGRVPAAMFGLMPTLEPGQLLFGASYRDGKRVGMSLEDRSREVLSAPGLWLALCLPVAPPEDYEALFTKKGYQIAGQYAFHRIRLYHFVQRSTPPTSGAGVVDRSSPPPPGNDLDKRLPEAARQ
jgi:hypothetical protein